MENVSFKLKSKTLKQPNSQVIYDPQSGLSKSIAKFTQTRLIEIKASVIIPS